MKTQREYRLETWVSEKLEQRSSPIDGIGIFTKMRIALGECVIIWGGTLFTQAEIDAGLARGHTNVAIGEGLYLATPIDQEKSLDDDMNHSCDPNLWMRDEVTLVARRPIEISEELTADYAMFQTNEEYLMKKRCNCGNTSCRGIITGRDWRNSQLQEAYFGHFSPFLNERISKSKGRN